MNLLVHLHTLLANYNLSLKHVNVKLKKKKIQRKFKQVLILPGYTFFLIPFRSDILF